MDEKKLLELLYFLWKWKVVSVKALMHKFFDDCAPNTAYNRLLRLRHDNLLAIKSDSDGKEKYAVILGLKGFHVIKDHLPPLRSDGFRSEKFQHDLVVTAAHLGEWVKNVPPGVKMFSEQELRRIHYDYFPTWVPKPPMGQGNQEYLHTPDGYWNLPHLNSSLTLALEVEFHLKSRALYQSIFKFYADHPGIFRVIWIVPKASWAGVLYEKMMRSPFPKSDIHNFICFEDFKKLGWTAPVFHGPEKERTLFSLLHLGQGKNQGSFPAFDHLDTRKSPHRSKTSKTIEFLDVVT